MTPKNGLAPTSSGPDAGGDADDLRIIARLSLSYVFSTISMMANFGQLDLLDLMIAFGISNLNLSRLNSDPALSRQFAGPTQPETDAVRVPVSRTAIAAALNIPLETVRRRCNALVKAGVLKEVGGKGLILPSRDPANSGGNLAAAAVNAQMVRDLYRTLKAHGVRID